MWQFLKKFKKIKKISRNAGGIEHQGLTLLYARMVLAIVTIKKYLKISLVTCCQMAKKYENAPRTGTEKGVDRSALCQSDLGMPDSTLDKSTLDKSRLKHWVVSTVPVTPVSVWTGV